MTDWIRPPSPMARLLAALALAITAAGHSDAATEAGLLGESFPEGTEFVPAMLDLSHHEFDLTEVPLHAVTPEMARNIGPGSLLFILRDNRTFGCTANFIWEDAGKHYLGSAGHCFLPEDKAATHGPGADYDASKVDVFVCVEGCTNGGFASRITRITGSIVKLGSVAYARQHSQDGNPAGHDFGIVEIQKELATLIRPSMPVFGGPYRTGTVRPGDLVCHYGNGVGLGEAYPTMGRVGLGGGSNGRYWFANTAASFGDSGSALQVCQRDEVGVHGHAAAGILTHLSNPFYHGGIVLGTTVARAIEMTRNDRNLSISVVLP